MSQNISIIICTRNRAEDLRQTLACLAAASVPDGWAVELIVVDNGSSDGTAQVVCQTAPPHIPTRCIHEPRMGKGYAYNSGLAAATGEALLFTDDDVRPPVEWLTGMCAPILSNQSLAVQGGIRIAPHLVRNWMLPVHYGCLAHLTGSNSASISELVGANMAFSKRALADVPAFDTELGPGRLGFWDETLFSKQLLLAGHTIASALETCVEHHFDAKRLRHSGFVDHAQKMGRSAAYVAYHWEHRDIADARYQEARARLRLFYYRSYKGNKWLQAEGISEWEWSMIRDVAFYNQYRQEQRKPRSYAKHGLIKQC